MGWRFVIADSGGRSLGEPRARNRSFSANVAALRTAALELHSSDPLYETAGDGDSTLKVYDSAGNLSLYGPLVVDEEVAEGQGAILRLTATELAWRLGRRYIGKVGAGGSAFTRTTIDSGEIMFDVLDDVNATEDTGIAAGNADTFVARTITYTWKKALDVLNELGAIEGSYEWQLRYVDGASGSTPSVFLDLLARVGQDRTGTCFLEYGTGILEPGDAAAYAKAAKSYRRARTKDFLATDVYVLGAGAMVASASDAEARARRRRHEDVISFTDITVTALLDALAAAHVAVRKAPRELIDIQPIPRRTLRYGVDYTEGDTITGRALVGGKLRVNGTVRVWGTTVAIDEEGNEVPTLRLEPQ